MPIQVSDFSLDIDVLKQKLRTEAKKQFGKISPIRRNENENSYTIMRGRVLQYWFNKPSGSSALIQLDMKTGNIVNRSEIGGLN